MIGISQFIMITEIAPILPPRPANVPTDLPLSKSLGIGQSVAGAKIPAVTFITPTGLTTRELAHMLDSLVRVSRRVE